MTRDSARHSLTDDFVTAIREERVLRVTGKRRSRPLFIACAGGIVLGAIPVALFLLFTGNMFALITLGIYAFVGTSTVYARLAGIQL